MSNTVLNLFHSFLLLFKKKKCYFSLSLSIVTVLKIVSLRMVMLNSCQSVSQLAHVLCELIKSSPYAFVNFSIFKNVS